MVNIKEAKEILFNNYTAQRGSFLHYLHEQDSYSKKHIDMLCESIEILAESEKEDDIKGQICFIYGQILKHIIYHFDPNDNSVIKNLPQTYYEDIETLSDSISKYFNIMK